MLFQTFDDKKDCIAIYAQGKMHAKNYPRDISQTWEYSESLVDKDIEYAKHYCGGLTLSEACPDHYKKEWDQVSQRLQAFHRSVKEARLNLNDHCFFDLLPEHFLLEYGRIKNKICNYVFKNYEKPENYDFIVSLVKVLTEIKNSKLNVDTSILKNRRHEFRTRQFIRKINETSPYINYNAYGTKTGRLTAKSFPILTMDKSYRKILKPNNEWFLEFDFNAAELRVMLSLLGHEQPQEDIHEWNAQNVFKGTLTREKAKKRTFAWLYNEKSKETSLNSIYDRNKIKEKYWDGEKVRTVFNREIESDEYHAINYIIQSTAADLFLRQMIKVWEILRDRKSHIAFCLHDSLVIDFSDEDVDIINDLKNAFANTPLGEFKINTFGGKDFGNMKRMNVR